MKLATTTGDFLAWTKTPAEAVSLFEGTGFRHLDYNFYRVIYPGSPFLGDRWLDEVEAAGREAERLGLDFVQAHSPNYNPFDPKADHEVGMLATLRSIEACGRLGIRNIVRGKAAVNGLLFYSATADRSWHDILLSDICHLYYTAIKDICQ